MNSMKKLFYIIFIFLFQVKSSENDIITVISKNEISTICNEGLYFIDIKVNFSSPFDNYITFPLDLESPPYIKFKCIMTYQNSSILCFTNLYSNKFDLEIGEFIIFPSEFPKIESIEWDYDSFIKNIYGRQWVIENDCSSYNIDNFHSKEWGLVANINEMYDNLCSYSVDTKEIRYNFKMRVNLIGGRLKEILENINEDTNINNNNNNKELKSFEIEFVQDIWVPLLINVRKDIFRKIDDFPFAFCSLNEKISENNIDYLMKRGFELDCNINIPERKLLIGIIKIKPFYDYLYMKINRQKGSINNENDNEIILGNIFFNINRTLDSIDSNEKNLLNNQIEKEKNPFFPDSNHFRRIDENNNDNENITISDILVIEDNNNTTDNNNSNSNPNSGNNEIENNDNNNHKSGNEENDKNNTNGGVAKDTNNYNNSNNNNTVNNDNNNNNKNDDTVNNDNNNENNEETNQEKTTIQYIEYFLLYGKSNKIYCPDKPIFTIKDSNKDIILYSSKETEYTFLLKGYLSNGLQEVDDKMVSIVEIYDPISFSLQIIDNLAEDEDDQRAEAYCKIPANTQFFHIITVLCTANKISYESMKTNDTDITLNWNTEKNRLHEDIIIQWPDEKRKYKHMYSYTLNGFSLVQTNYGCHNNEFYFYIYIFDLNNEPDISFELVMKNPVEPKAICKLYDSSILRCYFPLYQQRLEKNTIIDMPTNYTYYSVDAKGNKVIFNVDDYDDDYEDMHITVKETCGDNFIVGALKKAGLDYFKVFLIVLGIGVFAFIVFICFLCYVYYKIKYRNRKGHYIRHIEEDYINEGKKEKEHKVDNVVLSN